MVYRTIHITTQCLLIPLLGEEENGAEVDRRRLWRRLVR